MNTHTDTQAAGAAAERSMGRKVVYVINERNGKSYWTRIGFGSVNKDGSLNLKLDAVPCTGGTLQVRDWEPRDEQVGAPRSESGASSSTGPAALA